MASGNTKENGKLQQKQFVTLKLQYAKLSKLIIRLTHYYIGINPELDVEVANLRAHLGGQGNFALAEVSMRKINNLLMQHPDCQEWLQRAIKETQLKLLTVSQRQHLTTEYKDDISRLLGQLKNYNDNLPKLLPLFAQVMSLLIALSEPKSDTSKRFLAAEKQWHASQASRLHDEIIEQISELLEQLSNEAPSSSPELTAIKGRLRKGISHEELLESCLVIFRAIVADVVKERKHAERFISGLHSSLVKMNSSVSRSLADAEAQSQMKQDSHQNLKQQLSEMEDVVESTQNLEELKQRASEYLGKISASLESREVAEQEEQNVLIQLLKDMHQQLSSLEKQTADYKHRLLEQRFSSQLDGLTQLPNRMAYNERVATEYERWQKVGGHLSLVVIDVDHFKKINDTYGHAAGDKTLQVIASNLSQSIRNADFIGRWGGEEFIAIFVGLSEPELADALERMRQKIEKIPFKFKQTKVTITVSIGASSFKSKDDISTVFERADEALYKAKSDGRNRVISAV